MEWREVKGFPNYQVNNDGDIRSVDRNMLDKNDKPYKRKGKLLAPNKTNSGYYAVVLYKNGERNRKLTHRLVLSSFSDFDELKQVNHINGIKTDNRLSNLESCTASENQLHAVRTGLVRTKRGAEVYNAKLDDMKCLAIKTLVSVGVMQKTLCEHYNVKPMTISKMVRGKTWKHINV